MAKDVITRFKLETTGFDSKIKEAAKELSAYSKTATQAKEGFNQFTKANVDAARALGTIATSTTNAKDRAKELVGAFNEAAKAYNSLTKEQQQSDFGRAMAGSLQQLQVRIREAKQELYGLDSAMKKVSKGNNTMNQLLGGVAGKFGMSASMFTGVGAAVAGVGAAYKAISDNISTAMGFEKSMSQLSSLTGMVGKDLEQLKEYAIELGSTSTLTASQVADAFRLIGSQQPQLLSSGEALKEVTKYAITLSEAAGIDLVTAAQTLSTSINQMGGDSDNAARYVNVLAAASQKGAGDIAWLGEAITKSATAAKAVGTDYEELVANLEQLAKGGFDASTAGTALRSIIMNLEKQANQEFKPSIVGLTQAFENLGKANLDIVGYQEIAGKMFASQAKVLADAAGEARNMTTAITGTNTATEQATTNTTNLEGSLKALASAWEGLNLHLNSSNGYLKTIVDGLKDVVVWADKAISGLGEVNGNREKLNGEGNGGQTKVDRMVGNLKNTSIDRRQSVYTQQVSAYWKYINDWDKKLKEAESRKDVFAWETIKKNNDIAEAKANIAGAQSMLKEYQSKAQKYLKTSSPAPSKVGSNNGIVVDVDVDTEEGTKSIKELQNEIKKLKKLRDDAAGAGDTKLRDQYNAQIKSVQAEIKSMRGTGSTSTTHKTVQTELQQNQTKINTLTQEYVKLGDESTEAARKRQEEIRKEIELLKQRNGLLGKRAEQAHGRLLSTDDMKRKAEIDMQVNTKQIEDLRRQLTEIEKTTATVNVDATHSPDFLGFSKGAAKPREAGGIGSSQKSVTITATDEALPKLREIEGITIADKTMTVTAETADALRALQAIEGVTIDPKTVTITATDEALPKLREIDGITIDDKTMTVTAETADALRALQGIEGVTIDPKSVTITAKDESLPKLREIEGITIDDKTMTVIAETADALRALQGIEGVTIDPKSITIIATDEAMPKLREIEGITIDDKTMTVTAETADALRALQGIEGVTIDPKTVTITATDEALPKLREIEGITIDDKTMTVTANTADALRSLQGIEGVTIEPKTTEVNANTSEAQQKIDELKAKIAELEDKNINIQAFVESIGKPLGEGLNKTPVTLLKAPTTAVYEDGVMTEKAVHRGGLQLYDKDMKAVRKNIDDSLPKKEKKDSQMDSSKKMLNAISQLTGGLQQMGIELPSEIQGVIGVIQGAMQVIEAVNTIIGVTQTSALTANTAAMISLEAALWANTATSIIPFANGGIVPGFANGGVIESGHSPSFLSFSKAAPSFATGGVVPQTFTSMPKFATGGIIQKFNDGGTVEAGHAPDFLSFSKAMPKFATGGIIQKFNEGGTVEAGHAPDFLSFSKAMPKRFASGGTVPHAANGYFIGGSHFSGDVTPIMANAGELVLNKAQQGVIANQLQGGNNNNVENRQPYVNGESIYLGLNNYLKRTGRGEIVVSKR